MQTPATPAIAVQTPESISASACRFTPNAVAMGPSSAAPRDAECEERRHDQRERQQRIDLADRRKLIAEVSREERQREVREVDLAQKPPRQAEPEAEQPIEGSDEDPRQHGLRE